MLVRASTIESVPPDENVTTYRATSLGPIIFGEVTFRQELRLECDDAGSGFFLHLPIAGRYHSRYRGVDMMVSRVSSAVFRPDGGSLTTIFPPGFQSLCVRVDMAAVTSALARLTGDPAPRRVTFDPAVNLARGLGRSWTELVFSVNRQLSAPNGLLTQPLVTAPLAESLVNGFLLAATQSHPGALAEPAAAARPAAVRTAIDIIEADPLAPLTLSTLAEQCAVNPRTLQKAFQQHLGTSPMAYLRQVRLRGAHEELQATDPFIDSVAAVARRWGFSHLGRFAAAHEAKYGQTPLRTLRG
jgi:AraC-like DNA-binding protein